MYKSLATLPWEEFWIWCGKGVKMKYCRGNFFRLEKLILFFSRQNLRHKLKLWISVAYTYVCRVSGKILSKLWISWIIKTGTYEPYAFWAPTKRLWLIKVLVKHLKGQWHEISNTWKGYGWICLIKHCQRI